MRKKYGVLLALAFLLAVLAACQTDMEGAAETDEEQSRSVETYTPEHLYTGTFTDYPGQLAIYPDWDAFVCDGTFRLRVTETLSQPDGYGRTQRPAFLTVSSDGSFEITPISAGAPLTNGMDRTTVHAIAVGENRFAVIDHNFQLDEVGKRILQQSEPLLTVYDGAGKVLWSCPAEDLVTQRTNPVTGRDSDYSFTVRGLHFAPGGTLYMISEYSVIALSSTGEKLYETGAGFYIDNFHRTADGHLLLQITDAAQGKQIFVYMDDAAKGFSAPVTIPDPGFAEYTLHTGAEFDWYYRTSDGLYGMNEADESPTLLCSWEASSLDPAFIKNILILDANTFFLFYEEYPSLRNEFAVLHRVPAEEIQPRKIVTLGNTDPSVDFTGYSNHLLRFNRQSCEYRLVLRDYKMEASAAGTTAEHLFQEEMLGGKAPDIVFASGFTEIMTNLADKGAFLDLNTFLETDAACREDLLSCALEPFETDGKLYQLASYVRLKGISGKAENLPSPDEWTTEKFFALLGECAQNGKILLPSLTTRETMENFLIYSSLPTFVDYEKFVCSFESELFLTTLKYLKTLPPKDTVAAADAMEADAKNMLECRENRLLTNTSVTLGDFAGVLLLQQIFGDKDLTYLGVPTPAGGRPILEAAYAYSITADSPVKEGAWEFVRYMLTEETLRVPGNAFPSGRTLLMRQAEEKKNHYYVAQLDRFGMIGHNWDRKTPPKEHDPRTQMALYLTDADVEFVLELLDSRDLYVNARSGADETICAVIAEEIGPYYTGSITAEEAAQRIQSRVSIYLAEQS